MRWGEHLNKGETFLKNIQKTHQKRKNTRTTPTPPAIPIMSSPGKPSSIPTVLKEQFKNTPNPRPTRGFYLDFCRFFGSSGNSTGSWMAWKRVVFHQASWKRCAVVKLDHETPGKIKNKKHLSCHHLDFKDLFV